MKLRIPATLGALAATAMVAMALSPSAHAAEGLLVVNNTGYENPSGCINLEGNTQEVTNTTNADAVFYSLPNCEGEKTGTVFANTDGQSTGDSVRVS